MGVQRSSDSSFMINEIGDFSSVECDLESTRRVLQATMLKQLEISKARENLQQSKLHELRTIHTLLGFHVRIYNTVNRPTNKGQDNK
ncbi:hypothetical protein Dimus_023017 [Dionaea muscipula]